MDIHRIICTPLKLFITRPIYLTNLIIEYLNFYRIEIACEQLLSTDLSVTDIAINCGFNDVSYFIKTFKKYKGITPKQYIKKIF